MTLFAIDSTYFLHLLVFYCYSPSTSRFNVLWVQRFCSAYQYCDMVIWVMVTFFSAWSYQTGQLQLVTYNQIQLQWYVHCTGTAVVLYYFASHCTPVSYFQQIMIIMQYTKGISKLLVSAMQIYLWYYTFLYLTHTVKKKTYRVQWFSVW